ncbi:MAG TPA: helix-turn-helix transcriptional regulator [Streptosporangiaceae bacterium]
MLVGPTIRRRRLGSDLRRLREQRSLRLEEVASELGVAPSTLSRIETGKAPTRTSYLALMLDLYGVHDAAQRRTLMDLAREGQRKGWWVGSEDLLPAGTGTYLGLEAEAFELRAFQSQIVHALLWTREYARAVIAARRPGLAASQAERLVEIGMRRQDVLAGDEPMRLRLILDESVLSRAVATRDVMRAQLEHVIDAGSAPHVTIQVLRLGCQQRQLPAGSFGILSFAEPDDADVACSTGIRGQVLLEQRVSEVREVRRMFDALSESALAPEESAQLIDATASKL